MEAIIIRTPIGSKDKNINFSGTNPPFLTPSAMEYLKDFGCKHLLVDLPSVDKENDGGFLASHSIFFGLPGRDLDNPKAISDSNADISRKGCTITELCFIEESIPDGEYYLNLQVSPLLLDAIPSRPILFSK